MEVGVEFCDIMHLNVFNYFNVLWCSVYKLICILHTANEGPVRIQYKCLVPIYVSQK
jgi:hypothetical protein